MSGTVACSRCGAMGHWADVQLPASGRIRYLCSECCFVIASSNGIKTADDPMASIAESLKGIAKDVRLLRETVDDWLRGSRS